LKGASLAAVVAVLAQFALDQVHHALTALDIWRHLETVGCRRREWQNDARVLAAVDAQNQRFVNILEDEAIGGFQRHEASLALPKLLSQSSSQSLIFLGDAGIGKSSITPEVMEGLATAGWPVLAFRVDRLESASTPDQVGRELNLPGHRRACSRQSLRVDPARCLSISLMLSVSPPADVPPSSNVSTKYQTGPQLSEPARLHHI
jgi:hypothetical protein